LRSDWPQLRCSTSVPGQGLTSVPGYERGWGTEVDAEPGTEVRAGAGPGTEVEAELGTEVSAETGPGTEVRAGPGTEVTEDPEVGEDPESSRRSC
jgi:hypothetical protein